MDSIIWFDVCALVVVTLLLFIYYTKYHAPFQKYRIFLGMLWNAEISTITSLLSVWLPGIAPVWVLELINTAYFITHGLLLPALLLYSFSLTDYTLSGLYRLIPWLMPSGFEMLLVLTGWYSGALFTVDAAGVYHRGPMLVLIYMVTAINFACIAYQLIKNWKIIPKYEAKSLLFFLAGVLLAVVLQLLVPKMQVENFMIAVCLMISQLTVQNPELIMDGTTGMLNKQGFASLISPMFDQEKPFQMGFLMVDNYHHLEKIYGFTRLENRITVLTEYLKQHSGDVFARLENRLFCFVPDNFRNGDGWIALLQDLEERTLVNNLLQGEQIGIPIQVKVGILTSPEEVDSFGSLLELVDVAAKIPMSENQTVLRLSPVDVKQLRRRRQIDELVRSAVQDNSLYLVYQPIYGVQEQRFCSAEALLRMHTEKLGNISPAEFIQIAEENGAILQLTRFVVETACNFIRNYNMQQLQLGGIHINLSAIDCAQDDLADQILGTIQRCGVEPGMISAEITETAFSSMPDSILSNLTDLSKAGISIMLDDYGTGYSNLNRLYSMPLDVVKLDRSLVQDILTSEAARIVLENTIRMMKRLNKRVLVEGVETKEQAEYLISQGVSYIQGFYYAKPMDAVHLEALFREQSKAAAK